MDKILEVRKEITRIAKMKGATRKECHDLIKKESEKLAAQELKILIKEYHRDLATFDRLNEVKELISAFYTGIGFLLTIFGIFCNGTGLDFDTYSMLLGLVGIYAIGGIVVLSGIQTYRSRNLNRTQYILDVLEE